MFTIDMQYHYQMLELFVLDNWLYILGWGTVLFFLWQKLKSRIAKGVLFWIYVAMGLNCIASDSLINIVGMEALYSEDTKSYVSMCLAAIGICSMAALIGFAINKQEKLVRYALGTFVVYLCSTSLVLSLFGQSARFQNMNIKQQSIEKSAELQALAANDLGGSIGACNDANKLKNCAEQDLYGKMVNSTNEATNFLMQKKASADQVTTAALPFMSPQAGQRLVSIAISLSMTFGSFWCFYLASQLKESDPQSGSKSDQKSNRSGLGLVFSRPLSAIRLASSAAVCKISSISPFRDKGRPEADSKSKPADRVDKVSVLSDYRSKNPDKKLTREEARAILKQNGLTPGDNSSLGKIVKNVNRGKAS